jgi:hypothetical protein
MTSASTRSRRQVKRKTNERLLSLLGVSPFTPPFLGWSYPPCVGNSCAKFAPGILAQSLRQEFLRKICARNSCAKFAPGILAQNLRQESCATRAGTPHT